MLFPKTILPLIVCSFVATENMAQGSCTALGQNPSTAFPVCGTGIFYQASVPVCGGRILPCPCPITGTFQPFTDKNPYWYKFTCFSGGTLAFTITPNAIDEDYDWQLFDVTNHNPDDVYTDSTLFVACDWTHEFGITGAAPPPLGNSLIECEGPGVPLFSSMPILVKGHHYLLLVSHFSDSQSGYGLSFGGGMAVITDPAAPHLSYAKSSCDGSTAVIKLNKKMKCNSLSPGGEEFIISPPAANIFQAKGQGCSNGFDMDSVIIYFDNPLPPGNYLITIGNGPDGNTLTDNCDAEVPVGETIPLRVIPFLPVPMDSLTRVKCAPDSLQLVFKYGIVCSSIAADGSDFQVSGPTPVRVTRANGDCSNGITNRITVHLDHAILTNGNYQLKLLRGSDGNTLVSECMLETPAGSTLNFNTSDTVNARFSFNIQYGCKNDTVMYFHDGRNGVNDWEWNFDNYIYSRSQDTSIIYPFFGPKLTRLTVSNGVCSDRSSFVPVLLDNSLKALFEFSSPVCPGEPVIFQDNSIGKIIFWNWGFGNGNTSILQIPPRQFYPASRISSEELVQLTVQNGMGCKDSALGKISVGGNCRIMVPGAFTPNGDGLNDELYPLNAYKVTDLLFSVFDRFGQQVFESKDFNNRWNGDIRGKPADAGAYVWILRYTNDVTGQKVEQRGSSILIR